MSIGGTLAGGTAQWLYDGQFYGQGMVWGASRVGP